MSAKIALTTVQITLCFASCNFPVAVQVFPKGQFRRDGHTIQTLYCVVISCKIISSIFITLQAIKVGPELEVSHNISYFYIKGEGLGLLNKGV